MKSLRLKKVAELVDKDASVIDIGTDHAYLPVYLYKENITHNITATDVSSKVLESSLKTLKKYNLDNKIPLILSDGFKNIHKTFDIAIIAGMGTTTIINILKDTINLPNTLIIETQNDYHLLRNCLNELGYKIDKEIVINEKNIFYIIMKYIKGNEVLTKEELLFGKSNNKEYFNYLYNLYNDLYNKSKKEEYLEYIQILDKLK